MTKTLKFYIEIPDKEDQYEARERISEALSQYFESFSITLITELASVPFDDVDNEPTPPPDEQEIKEDAKELKERDDN